MVGVHTYILASSSSSFVTLDAFRMAEFRFQKRARRSYLGTAVKVYGWCAYIYFGLHQLIFRLLSLWTDCPEFSSSEWFECWLHCGLSCSTEPKKISLNVHTSPKQSIAISMIKDINQSLRTRINHRIKINDKGQQSIMMRKTF